jgi:ribosomal protein S18 acetylase RimI-like enzyme
LRPAARGNRLGEWLLRTAVTYAAERDLALILDVVDEGRSAAIRLYERLGWQLVALRPASWLTPQRGPPQTACLRLSLPLPTDD